VEQKMKNIKVNISTDGLTAFLTIEEDAGKFPDEMIIESALQDAGVIFGVDHSLVREIVATKKNIYEKPIAFGRHRHNLEQSQLVWYVDLAMQYKPRITVNGKANFKELKMVELVRQNQEIVSMVPLPENFTNKKVTGEEFYTPESYLEHIKGKNLRLSSDGLTLIANIDGCAFWKDGKLNVDNIYNINGDVDFRTGNVRFDGTILIDGDVRSGFRVNATGSIYINGSVEAAEVYSEKGNIIVKSGILGRGRARLIAGGSLYCHYVQDAVIGVKKDVVIEHYAINTSISAGGSIFLIQNEGLIRGGKSYAEQGMRAIEVGSPQNIPTSIGLSGAEFSSLDAQNVALQRESEELHIKLSRISKKVEFLRLLEQRLPRISEEKREDLAKAIAEVEFIEEQLEALEQKKAQILEKSLLLDRQNNIEIYKTLHRGVLITIGDKEFLNEATLYNVRIFRRGNEIIIKKCGV